MLRPDSGKIALDAADITSLRPDARVKRGPHGFPDQHAVSALERAGSVTLAVLEDKVTRKPGGNLCPLPRRHRRSAHHPGFIDLGSVAIG